MKNRLFNSLFLGLVSFITLVVAISIFLSAEQSKGVTYELARSNSMEPTYLTHSVLKVDHNVPFNTIRVGDVVLYQNSSDSDMKFTITHRVTSRSDKWVMTAGDNEINITDLVAVFGEKRVFENGVTSAFYEGKVVDNYNFTTYLFDWFFSNETVVGQVPKDLPVKVLIFLIVVIFMLSFLNYEVLVTIENKRVKGVIK